MKRFCEDLREHAMKMIDYEKKEMIPLKKHLLLMCSMELHSTKTIIK